MTDKENAIRILMEEGFKKRQEARFKAAKEDTAKSKPAQKSSFDNVPRRKLEKGIVLSAWDKLRLGLEQKDEDTRKGGKNDDR